VSAGELVEIAGLVIAVASLVCSVLNAGIRSAVEHGARVPMWLLIAGAMLNAVALNGDKTTQMLRGYRGPSMPPPTMPTGWR
jgi:hypothetical protein